MNHPNLDLIERFFAAYGNRDGDLLREVLAEQATWTFPGHHPLSGTKVGSDAIVAFFDAMGAVMESSNANVERLIVGVNEHYVTECQRVQMSRTGGPHLDQILCVLWGFEHDRIVSGLHLSADQDALDLFFTTALS